MNHWNYLVTVKIDNATRATVSTQAAHPAHAVEKVISYFVSTGIEAKRIATLCVETVWFID